MNGRNRFVSSDALRSILETTLATNGSSIQSVRFAIEKWFNDTMDRASGWYKRRTQLCLLTLGLAVAFGGDLSTVSIARWLWTSDAARQAALSAAQQYVQSHPTRATNNQQALSDIAAEITQHDQDLFNRQCPIAWNMEYLKQRNAMFWTLEYFSGCIITGIAISMGSSFWFDALQNLIKIRGAGPKPT